MWARAEALLRVVRRIAGMPDYAAYVEHARRCHPEQAVRCEREFYEEFLRARYEGGPTRCC
ncbi:MAG TPA: YbdD/YjiX family protein [Gemmatimonadales bacterium]|nr:YbdD/YjiX family protein [Gemmatimonadales bacterium]